MPFWSKSEDDGKTFTPVGDHLKKINVDTNAIGVALDGFTGEEGTDNAVQESSDKLGATIQAAIDEVEQMKSISYMTATGLLVIFQSLIPDTKAMLEKFTVKKELFVKAGLAPVVVANLEKQQVLGAKLDATIYSKLPMLAQPLSKGQYSQIDAMLIEAIAEWKAAVPAEAPATA